MELHDRCHGAMVGLAVGNLFGLACEGWERGEIRRRWPDGIREIEAEPGYPDDDDLAQAVVLAEACVGAGALDVEDLARRFWTWGEESGLGIGNATHAALTRYGGSPPRRYMHHHLFARLHGLELPGFQSAREPVGLPALEASRAAWETSDGNAAGNGAVMRCAPVAIRWRYDDAALVRNTAASAAVTHWDPRCVWSAVFVNLTIASLLRQPPDDELRVSSSAPSGPGRRWALSGRSASTRPCRRRHGHQRRGGGRRARCAIRTPRGAGALAPSGCGIAGRPGGDGSVG